MLGTYPRAYSTHFQPSARDAGGLAFFLAAYNNVLNATPVAASSYVPVNATLAGAILAYGRSRGLSAADMGLNPADLARGLRVGGVAAAAVVASLGVAVLVPAVAPLLRDERISRLDRTALTTWVLVRIPAGTVLLEEVAFRGVLYGLLASRTSPAAAVTRSSAVFGVWHVAPTWLAVRANLPDLPAAKVAAVVTGGVVATAAAGAVFCGLRLRSGSLLAPMLVHVATNAGAAVAAFVALRRTTDLGREEPARSTELKARGPGRNGLGGPS